ncbi:EboA domain-containing protein [Rubinisphaera margarita]|uniref:EboA domain-containing protein n=1 Tax=Rubinisphaera margarita TaxID=2909586 RepID=UPI001EE92C81|nr:EboA domain-containing protein [Rubinisphaera margarita]MCG6157929.1 EboA domain-containing protein [Rubinisphaera margarita]
MAKQVQDCLREWICSRVDEPVVSWIDETTQRISDGDLKQLYLRFGLAARKVPKLDLNPSEDELASAEAVRPGWKPGNWSLLDAVRTLFVLSIPATDEQQYVATLDRLFAAGEVHELVALYQALPLYPFPTAHVNRTGEGIRTNMRSVFCSVAHRNVYPSEQLPEGLWNQMVLKCLFVEASLFPVVGLEERNNVTLSQMLSDYAHERWAARRTVHPELWRCVDIDRYEPAAADLERVLTEGNDVEKQAAALALKDRTSPAAQKLREANPELMAKVNSSEVTWETVYHQLFD